MLMSINTPWGGVTKYLIAAAAAACVCIGADAVTADDFLIHRFEPSSPSFDVTVTAVSQDSRGFMWFGTNSGLFRYDGYELLPVSYPALRPGYKRVRSICEDSNGDIWAGTNGGLVRWFRSSGLSEVFRPDDPGFSIISKVLPLPSGRIVFTARNYGAWILDPATGACSRVNLPGTAGDETLAVCLGDAGMVYFMSANCGLFRLDSSRPSAEAECIAIAGGNPLEGIVLYNIEYYDYHILAGIAGRTYIIDLRDGSVTERDWSQVNAVERRRGGGFYAATNSGLLEVDESFGLLRRWSEDRSDTYALHDDSVKALCVDREGDLWVGTAYSGLYFMARNRCDMLRYYPSASQSSSVIRIREIVEDGDVIWIGSENGGLIRYDRNTGEQARIPLPAGTSNILGLCVDGPWLWIGSYSRTNPTLRMDRRTLKVEAMPHLPKCLYYIYKDGNGHLLMSDDHTLFLYDTAADRVEKEDAVSPAGFQYVHGVQGADGEIWMGGTGAILCRYRDGVITPLSDMVTDEELRSLLQLRNASPKLVDSSGRLWITLLNMGLYRIDLLDGSVRCFDVLSSSCSSEVFNVMEDREGMIWVTTVNELILLNPESGDTFSYDANDGILSANFKSSSGIIASDGKLYAGLMDGMIVFDPVKFRNWPCEVCAPVFTSLRMIRSADSDDENAAEDYSAGLGTGEVSFRASQNAFVLGVSAMTYSIPRRSRLVYSLDGGEHWNNVKDGKIEFSRLSPGSYTVRVRSMMNNGVLDGRESVLHIHIRVPLLLSLPFIVLYVLLLAGLLTVVSYTSNARAMRMASEKHEISNQLSLIKAPVESLRMRLGGSADATVVREIDTVSSNADKLSAMLDSRLSPGSQIAGADGGAQVPPVVNVPGTGKKVLVVERDRGILNFLCTRFEDMYNVYPAPGMDAAREMLGDLVPDIVVCDTDYGSTESYAFCSWLKSASSTAAVPLVVISDNSGQDARVEAFNRGVEAFFSKPFSIAELLGTMRSLLDNRDKVKDSLAARPAMVADRDFLDRIQSIMKSRMADESLTVDSLAADAFMSTSGLFKKLKALTGMSPGEYIVASRMKEAASLLKDTALAIDDVSIKVGFRSHSYFSTCFRKHFGMSPTKYRQLSGPSDGL